MSDEPILTDIEIDAQDIISEASQKLEKLGFTHLLVASSPYKTKVGDSSEYDHKILYVAIGNKSLPDAAKRVASVAKDISDQLEKNF